MWPCKLRSARHWMISIILSLRRPSNNSVGLNKNINGTRCLISCWAKWVVENHAQHEVNRLWRSVFRLYGQHYYGSGESLQKCSWMMCSEAAFFLAASHGFKGRLYSDEERKSWGKAAVDAKSAMNYMDVCRKKITWALELLFGDALTITFGVGAGKLPIA